VVTRGREGQKKIGRNEGWEGEGGEKGREGGGRRERKEGRKEGQQEEVRKVGWKGGRKGGTVLAREFVHVSTRFPPKT
jgi:hypothetical protein